MFGNNIDLLVIIITGCNNFYIFNAAMSKVF